MGRVSIGRAVGFVFSSAVSNMTRERLAVGLLLVTTFAVRATHPGQPIVENYVGRQIPTAMVARNLELGSGFFRPQLDTGPFPNLFLVEPPIYAQLVVLVRPILGFDRDGTGRLVSAAATTLGAWGLYGLARRREGVAVALLAVASFEAFPVMVRYGRAFQPDALMVGFVLAGLRGWDEFQANGDRRWAAFGGFVLAAGLALKVTSAWALIAFAVLVVRLPVAVRLGLGAAMLAPAFSWYLLAWGEVGERAGGSLASSDNAAIWIRSISPTAWVRFATFENIARGLAIRSFTPVGFGLASLGLFLAGPLDRFWRAWGIGCALSVAGLAAKWHHGYYWMVVAPLAAIGVGRGLVGLWVRLDNPRGFDPGQAGMPAPPIVRWGRHSRLPPGFPSSRSDLSRGAAMILGPSFLALCVVQSASTFRTPPEWRALAEAAREVDAIVPSDGLLIAPEALLYFADRRGMRLEFDPAAARRAAGEWGGSLQDGDGPLALVEFYRGRPVTTAPGSWAYPVGASVVADSGPDSADPARRAWRAAIRARPNTTIRVDRPELLIAELH